MAMYPGQAYYHHNNHQQPMPYQQQQQPYPYNNNHNNYAPSTETLSMTSSSSSSSLPPGLTHSYHNTRSDMDMDSASHSQAMNHNRNQVQQNNNHFNMPLHHPVSPQPAIVDRQHQQQEQPQESSLYPSLRDHHELHLRQNIDNHNNHQHVHQQQLHSPPQLGRQYQFLQDPQQHQQPSYGQHPYQQHQQHQSPPSPAQTPAAPVAPMYPYQQIPTNHMQGYPIHLRGHSPAPLQYGNQQQHHNKPDNSNNTMNLMSSTGSGGGGGPDNGQLMTPTSGRSVLETEMPSLAYSEGNSSASKMMIGMENNPSPHLAHPSPSPSVSPQGDVAEAQQAEAEAEAEATGGPSDYFLTSVLNMIAPTEGTIPVVQHFDYLSEFTQRQRIAKGGNGEIRRAFWQQRQCYVILKSLIDTKHTPAKIAKLFDKEVEVMNQCREHSNIVQFYGVAIRRCDDERNGDRYMIMHYYEHGDLVKLLETPAHLPEAPTLTDKLFLALDIAQGLDHLYKCGFHHGDLHPKNVLIDIRRDRTPDQGRYQARLTDFGLRRIRDNTNAFSSQQFGGVWQFMAPERMPKTRPRYDVRCDIFALGVIYWQIMSGRYPFKDPSTFTPGAREGRIEGTPNWYHNVYTQAWSEDPNERQQTLEEIVQVFRYHLGIPSSPNGQNHTQLQHPHRLHQQCYLEPSSMVGSSHYPSPSFGFDNMMRVSPMQSPYEAAAVAAAAAAGHHNYSIASSYHGSPSPMMAPAVAQPPPAAGLPPSPLLTNSTVGSTGQRSSNPNHPRNRPAAVPNGMPQSVYRA